MGAGDGSAVGAVVGRLCIIGLSVGFSFFFPVGLTVGDSVGLLEDGIDGRVGRPLSSGEGDSVDSVGRSVGSLLG